MSKFSDKFIDGMSLVAEKVDENKFLGAIKDSFTIYMPFVIVGSFMSLFNTILCSTTTGLAKWIPALEALKPIFTAANFATLSCMTLPIVFLIGLKLGKKNNVPEHISAIMALASYLTICRRSFLWWWTTRPVPLAACPAQRWALRVCSWACWSPFWQASCSPS